MSSGRRAADVSTRMLVSRGLPLLAGIVGIASPVYFQLARLVFGCLALPKGGDFRTNPGGGPLFQSAEGWPPFVLPSGPFWLTSVALLALVVVVFLRRAESLDFALQPFVLSFWCGLAAFYSLAHSLFFVDLDAWPRDSFVAAFVLAAECLAFFILGILRTVESFLVKRERRCAKSTVEFRAVHGGVTHRDKS